MDVFEIEPEKIDNEKYLCNIFFANCDYENLTY